MRGRCYLRGTTPLGLFNTVVGCVFNRVLVRHKEPDSGQTIRWSWRKASAFPSSIPILPTDSAAVLARQWKHGMSGEVCHGCGHLKSEGHAAWCLIAPLYAALASVLVQRDALEKEYGELLSAMKRRDPGLDPVWMEQYATDRLVALARLREVGT